MDPTTQLPPPPPPPPAPPPPPPAPTLVDLDQLPPVLTTREAALALRIGVKELRKLVDTGHIPAARLGPRRLIRISRTALLATLGVRTA
jgi:excisionase family DNA binding protein